MSIDYGKLRWRMKELHVTQADLADKLGIDRATMNMKLTGKRDMSREEVAKTAQALHIEDDIGSYFFVY